MGIILTSAGLPLLSAAGLTAARAAVPVPVPKPKPGEITLQGPTSSIAYRGVTFNFSNPVYWFASANGDPIVVSHVDYLPSGSSITSMSPAGTTNAGGHRINGAQKNPADPMGSGSAVQAQGYDSAAAVLNGRVYAYDNTKNIDPGNTGAPIRINARDSFSVVKAVRKSGVGDGAALLIEKYVVLTVMGELPPGAGTWFRPNPCTTTKIWPGRVEDMVLTGETSPLRHLAKPAGLSNPSSYLAAIRNNDLLTVPIWMSSSEEGRRMQCTGEEQASSTNSGYSREIARFRGKAACSLFIDPSTWAEIDARRDLAIILVQWGIDTDGGYQIGMTHWNGAGQWAGFIEFHFLAAFLLGDAAMLQRAKIHNNNSIGQAIWITEDVIGADVKWDWGSAGSNVGYIGETYPVEMLGKPEWVHNSIQKTNKDATDYVGENPQWLNCSVYGVYRDVMMTTSIVEVFAIALLRNGPSGETGIAAIDRGQPPRPGSVFQTAALPLVDRSMVWSPWSFSGVGSHDTASRNIYALWRDEIPQDRWTGAPDIAASHDFPNFSTGTGSGQINWSRANYGYATETVTGRELSCSQDGIQFIDPVAIGTAGSYTLTGLRPGTPHWCRWRQSSASGSSPWSPSWEQIHQEGGYSNSAFKAPRNRVSSSGAVSGALTNTVAPAIHYKPYPLHEMPYFEPAPADLGAAAVYRTDEVRTLYAGIGYWTGGTGALSAVYQWQRDNSGRGSFADIPGATGQSYARQSADSGCQIRCVVTVDGVAAESNAVRISATALSVPAKA